jgi:hypothetical protein
LISSRIYVVSHCLLVSPAAADVVEPISAALATISANPDERDLLDGLGAPNGWEPTTAEAVEFVIDLMDALGQ